MDPSRSRGGGHGHVPQGRGTDPPPLYGPLGVKIARREIQVWKCRTLPLPKTSNPLREWRRSVQIFPWLSLLARRVLEIPPTSASPERQFCTLGNTMMTRKRCSLSCDNLQECVYLHEACPQVCRWSADKKVLNMD